MALGSLLDVWDLTVGGDSMHWIHHFAMSVSSSILDQFTWDTPPSISHASDLASPMYLCRLHNHGIGLEMSPAAVHMSRSRENASSAPRFCIHGVNARPEMIVHLSILPTYYVPRYVPPAIHGSSCRPPRLRKGCSNAEGFVCGSVSSVLYLLVSTEVCTGT